VRSGGRKVRVRPRRYEVTAKERLAGLAGGSVRPQSLLAVYLAYRCSQEGAGRPAGRREPAGRERRRGNAFR